MIYDYRCDNCKKDYEIMKKISEYDPKEPCEVCGEPMKRKMPKEFGVSVNCSGFCGTRN